MRITREQAWELLTEFTQSESLRKHGMAVEAAMRALAPEYGGDPEWWGIAGLIHDFDYEQNPTVDDHGKVGARILRERGWPEELAHAVESHNDFQGVPRNTDMTRALFSVDELAGFLTAVALVRPSKSIHDVDVASVKKKFKDKAFARGVNRDDIFKGIAELGVDQDAHIARTIQALRAAAPAMGLQGAAPPESPG